MTRALGLTAVLLVAVACDARPKVADPTGAHPRSGAALVVLDLSKGVPEKDTSSIFSVTHHGTFDELAHVLAELESDKALRGVFVRFGTTSIGLARATEIGEALATIRGANKPVVCHAEGFTNATYYTAARGCSKIIVAPAGEVETIGLAAELIYAHKLLADELHLSVDILQVGKFKGAEEPLTRDGPSDEARASLLGVLSDLRARWVEGIATGRGRGDAAEASEDGPYSAKRAHEVGLVDEVAYADDARDLARTGVGAVRDDVRFGSSDADQVDELGDVMRVLAGESGGVAPIALVRATGSIVMSGGGGLLGGSGGITAREMERVLGRLERDDDVRAVVLRIDSPGGSALASDLIWHRLMKLRAKKPLVISIGEMAASGGYYMACTGTTIFADPTSIVGSIGVVGGKIAGGDALQRIGVHAETLAANTHNPNAAARAAYDSPLEAWDDATRARVFESMRGTYELFLARVAEGRRADVDKIAVSAEGRIFSGTEGKARGLVDELGGLEAAIAKARELASLPRDARVEVVRAGRSVLDEIGVGGGGGEGDGESSAGVEHAPGAMNLIGEALPSLASLATCFAPLLAGERTLATLPYAVVVR